MPGPTTEFLGGLAQELGVYMIGGSILEEIPNPRNCIIHPPSSGQTARVGRLPQDTSLRCEGSGSRLPGEQDHRGRHEIVTAKAGAATIGLSVCYDVRFPELYRLLALRGAEVLAVPAAFTLQTGKDHWGASVASAGRGEPGLCRRPGPWGGRPTDVGPTDGPSSSIQVLCSPVPRPRRIRVRHPGPRLPRPL